MTTASDLEDTQVGRLAISVATESPSTLTVTSTYEAATITGSRVGPRRDGGAAMHMDRDEANWRALKKLLPSGGAPSPLNQLAIVGNGLDLASGLQSSYADFRDYFHDSCEETAIANLWQVFEQIDKVTEEDWSDFEDALGLVGLPEGIGERDHIDDPEGNDLDPLVEEGWRFGQDFVFVVSSLFSEWVDKSVGQSQPTATPNSVLNVIQNSDAFLSFNYTRTLEEHFSVPVDRVLHVHGLAGDSNGPYFGSPGASSEENFGGSTSTYYSARLSAGLALRSALEKVPRIELVNEFLAHAKPLKEVRSFGFSFGDADIPYLREVIEHCDDLTTWTQYCRASEEKQPEETTVARRCIEVVRKCGFKGPICFRRA